MHENYFYTQSHSFGISSRAEWPVVLEAVLRTLAIDSFIGELCVILLANCGYGNHEAKCYTEDWGKTDMAFMCNENLDNDLVKGIYHSQWISLPFITLNPITDGK